MKKQNHRLTVLFVLLICQNAFSEGDCTEDQISQYFQTNNNNNDYITNTCDETVNSDKITNNGNTQVTKQDKDEECKHKVFLAGSDDNLYKIMSEIYHTSKNKDNDLVIYFYFYRKRRFTYITSLNTNYEILNYVLTKYSHYFYINHNTNEPSNVRWYVNNLVMVPRRRYRDVFSGQDLSNFVDVDDETNDIEVNNISTGGNENANHNTCYQFTIPGDKNYKGRDINIDILQRYEELKQILKRGNACVSEDTNNKIKFAYTTDSDTAFKNDGVDYGQTKDFVCPDGIPNCLQNNGDFNCANEEIENIENPSDLNCIHKVYRDISNQAPYAKPKYYQFIMPDGRSYKAKGITIDLLNRQLCNENECPPKQNIELCQQNDDNTILCRSVRKPHDSIYTLNPYRINIPYDYRCYNPTNINSHSINYAGNNINIPCRNLDTAYVNTASTAENNCENDINIASANTNYDSTDVPCCCTNNPQRTDSILNLPQTVGNGNIFIPLTENTNNEFNCPGINYAGSNIYANLKENLFKPKEKQVLLNIQQRPGSYLPYQLKIQETPLKQYKISANDHLINVGNQDQNDVLRNIPVITNSQIPDPCVVEDNKQNIDIIPCYSASEILKMESDNDEENNNNEATNEKPFYYQGDRVNYRPPYLDHKTFWTPNMYSNYRPKDIDTSFNDRYLYSAYYPTKINPFIPNQSNVPTRDNILVIAPKQQPFVGPIREIPGVFKSEPKQYSYPASFPQNPYVYSTPITTQPDITIDKPNYVQEKPLFINMYKYKPSQNPQTESINIPQRYLIQDILNYPNQKYDNSSNIQPITINKNKIKEKYPTSYEPYVSSYEVKQPNYLNLKPIQLQPSINNLASESPTTNDLHENKLPSQVSQHLFSFPPVKYISTDNICPGIPYQTPYYKIKSYNQISNPAIRLQPAKSVFTKGISSTISTNNMYKPQNPYITEETQNTGSKENNQIELDTRPCAYKNKDKEYTKILLKPENKDTKELIDIQSNIYPEDVFNINKEPLHNNPIITSNIHHTGIYSPSQPSINNNGKLQYNPRNIGSPIIQVSPQKMYYLPKSYITPQNNFVPQNFVSTPDNSLETSSNISPSVNFPRNKIWCASKQPIEYPYEFPNEPIQNPQDNYQFPIQNFPLKNPYEIPCTPDQNLPVQNDYQTPCTSSRKLPFDNTYKTPCRYTQTLPFDNNQVPCSSIQELPVNTYQFPCKSNRQPSRNIYQYPVTPEESLSPQLTNQPWLNSLLNKIRYKPNYSNQNLPLTHIPYIIKPGVTNLYPYSIQTSPLKTHPNQPSSPKIYVSTPNDMNKVYPNNIINSNTDIDRNKAVPQYIYMPDGTIHPKHDSIVVEKPIYDNSNVYGSPKGKNNAYILPSNLQGQYKPTPVTFIIEKPKENVANPYYINAYLPQTAWSIPMRNKAKLNIEMNPNSEITSYQPDIVVQPSQIPYSKSFGQIPSLNIAVQPNFESQSYIPEVEKSLTSSSYPVQKIPLSNIETPLGRPTSTTYQPTILLYPSQPYLAKPNTPIIVVGPKSKSKYQPVLLVQRQTPGTKPYENEPILRPESSNIDSDLYQTKEFDQPIQTTYSKPSTDFPASNTYGNPTSESISYQPQAYIQPWQTPYTKTTENIPLNGNFKHNLHLPVYDPKVYQAQTVWPKLIQKIPLTNIEISPNSKSTMYQPIIYVQPAQSYLTKPNRNIPAFDIEVSPNTEKEKDKPNVLIEPSQNVWTKPCRNIPIFNVEVIPNSESEMHKPNIITQPSQNYWTNPYRNLPLPNIEEGPNSDSTQPKVFVKQSQNPWSKPFNNMPILNFEVKPNAESTMYKPNIFVQPSQNPRAKQYENEPVLNTEIDSYPEGSLYLPTVQPSINPWLKQIKNIPNYNIEVKPNAGSALYRPEFVLQPSQTPWSRPLSKVPTFVIKTVNYEPYQQELLPKPSQIKEPITNKPIFNVEVQPNAESTLYRPETIMLPSQLHWPKSLGQTPSIHVSPSLQSKPYQPVQVPLSKHNENKYHPIPHVETSPNPIIVLYQPLIEPKETSWSKPVENTPISNMEIRPSSASTVYPPKMFIQPSQMPHTNPFVISPKSDVEPNPNSQSILYQPEIYVQSPWHKSFGKIPITNMKINTETTYKPQPQAHWSKPITKIPSFNVVVNPTAEGTIYRPEMVVKPSQMPTKAFDNEISPNTNVNQNPQATMYTPNVQLSQNPRLQSFESITILDTEINPNHESSQYPPKQLILSTQTPSSNLVNNRFISNVLPSTGSSYRPQIFLQPSQGPSYKPYNNIPMINIDVSSTPETSTYTPELSPQSSQIPSKPIENIPLSDPKPTSEYTWSQPISPSLQTPWNKPSNIPVLNVEVNPNQYSKMYRPAVLLQPTHKSYSIHVENSPIIEVNPNQETTINQPKQYIQPSKTPWWQPFERIPVSGVEMNPNSQSTLYKPEIITQQFQRPIENVIIPNIDTRPGSQTNPYQSAFVSPSQTPHSQSLDKPTLDIEMGPSKSTSYQPDMFIQPSLNTPQNSLLSPSITVSPVPTINTPSSTFYTPDSKFTSTGGKLSKLPNIWSSPNQQQSPQRELNIILPNSKEPEYKYRPIYFHLKPYTNEVKEHPNPPFNNMNIASNIKNYSPEYKIISRPLQSENNINTPLINNFVIKADIDTKPTEDSTYFKPELNYSEPPKIDSLNAQPIIISTPNSEYKQNIPLVDVFSKPAYQPYKENQLSPENISDPKIPSNDYMLFNLESKPTYSYYRPYLNQIYPNKEIASNPYINWINPYFSEINAIPSPTNNLQNLPLTNKPFTNKQNPDLSIPKIQLNQYDIPSLQSQPTSSYYQPYINQIIPNQEHSPSKSPNDFINSYIPKLSITPVPNKVYSHNIPLTYDVKTIPTQYEPYSEALSSPESISKPKTPSQESPYPWLPIPSYYRTYSTEIGQNQQFEPASKPDINLINPEIGQSPEYELNNPSTYIKELFKDRIDYLVPKVLPTKYYDDNFNDPDLNKRDLKSIDLGDVAVAKYEPKGKILLKTDNPNIDLVAWRSKVKMLNAKLVFNIKDVSAVNFMPIIKQPIDLDREEIQNVAKDVIRRFYGDPIVVKGTFSSYKPYGVIYNPGSLRSPYYVLWPNYCNCGCMKSGCECQYSH